MESNTGKTFSVVSPKKSVINIFIRCQFTLQKFVEHQRPKMSLFSLEANLAPNGLNSPCVTFKPTPKVRQSALHEKDVRVFLRQWRIGWFQSRSWTKNFIFFFHNRSSSWTRCTRYFCTSHVLRQVCYTNLRD